MIVVLPIWARILVYESHHWLALFMSFLSVKHVVSQSQLHYHPAIVVKSYPVFTFNIGVYRLYCPLPATNWFHVHFMFVV